MASGFKKATVQSGKVASTQTNMPAYVDLSRLGITTLAEAESVRVYADSAKTTEWCREVVSATELHVKIPSLTTTVDIYIDYDGVRADYSVSGTYGRNNVWSAMRAVYHLNDENDSTANGYNMTQTTSGGVTFQAGKVGQDGSAGSTAGIGNKALRRASFALMTDAEYGGSWKYTYWIKRNNSDSIWVWMLMLRGSGTRYQNWNQHTNTATNSLGGGATGPSTGALTVGQYYKLDFVTDGSVMSLYLDGTYITAASGYKTPSTAFQDNFGFFGYVESSVVQSSPVNMDEVRMTVGSAHSSADWITTEYNNQNDEAAFWGTWADVGGGALMGNFFLVL